MIRAQEWLQSLLRRLPRPGNGSTAQARWLATAFAGATFCLVLILALARVSWLVSTAVLLVHLGGTGILLGLSSRAFQHLTDVVRCGRRQEAPEDSKPGPRIATELEKELRHLLEDFARSRTEMEQSHLATVKAMALALEARDQYTQGHCLRVRRLVRRILDAMGNSEDTRSPIETAALLHDIGKIGVPDSILHKPGGLTEAEYQRTRIHVHIGHELLSCLSSLKEAALYVRHHHERYDGGGYPDGLAGTDIPFGSRVIAVADCIDAMRSKRPYRDALTLEETLAELQCASGHQLDPEIVDTAVRLLAAAPPHPAAETTAQDCERALAHAP